MFGYYALMQKVAVGRTGRLGDGGPFGPWLVGGGLALRGKLGGAARSLTETDEHLFPVARRARGHGGTRIRGVETPRVSC